MGISERGSGSGEQGRTTDKSGRHKGKRSLFGAGRIIRINTEKGGSREKPPIDSYPELEERETNRISREFSVNSFSAEKAARILWTDAEWLRHVESAYLGLRYARVVLQDIRAIIAASSAETRPAGQELLRRVIVAVETLNLKQRLNDAGVPANNVTEVEESILKELWALRDQAIPTSKEALTLVDALLAQINDTLGTSNHPQFRKRARNLIVQVQALASGVSTELLAVCPAELIVGDHRIAAELSKTAVTAATLIFLAGIKGGGVAIWQQPDLAPHLKRAYEFVTRQVEHLTDKLAKRYDPTVAIETPINDIKRVSIAVQYGMYGIMKLIECTDGWDCLGHLVAGEHLIKTCSKIVTDCDAEPPISEQCVAASSEQLRQWLSQAWANLIPVPLALREEARLSMVTRIAESLGVGDFSLWKKVHWD